MASSAQGLEGSLIASLTERLAAPPVALAAHQAWPTLDAADDEYHRVQFSAQFDHAGEALVYASSRPFDPMFPDRATGCSHRHGSPTAASSSSIAASCRKAGRTRNRGPMGKSPARSILSAPCAGRIYGTGSPQMTTRRITSGSPRDPQVHCRRKGADFGSAVAPFYIEQEAPVPPGGLPQPGKPVVVLPDNHLQYAITWFGLATALVVVFVVWAFGSRRALLWHAGGLRFPCESVRLSITVPVAQCRAAASTLASLRRARRINSLFKCKTRALFRPGARPRRLISPRLCSRALPATAAYTCRNPGPQLEPELIASLSPAGPMRKSRSKSSAASSTTPSPRPISRAWQARPMALSAIPRWPP